MIRPLRVLGAVLIGAFLCIVVAGIAVEVYIGWRNALR
jgi:hypothetical protein